ncbi:diaminopropionate ammonia-lyase [Pseudaminobacter sp. 19-2017]|uniref:Diaminopropionate ammonia-lyase n=1 Tax=Pseudaminobacter soli (ex Zhang et al. 2022) TaxID=2831468 RepID=A0A942E0G0_9HYPH|nr:diaminopropionate ammonia-lyase [Pseudaminobacter soli]MBS3650572.1 diaminopropionate ammonia-lyase [Pseudaminobacter soli]
MKLVENRSSKRNASLSMAEAAIAGAKASETVREFLPAFPTYEPTPLTSLPSLAASLGIAGIDIKDESRRYGLGSFKALGGAYAVARLVREHCEPRLGRPIDPSELLSDEVRKLAADLTVCCATDGNHGRSVASGAQMFGCRCVIFLHSGVSAGREKAIAAFGAEIRRTAGNYDQSVAEASETGRREGWTVVSDFASEGYTEIPSLVMQGYTLMLDEIFAQAQRPYTHVFVQGGVGGLAAAVAGHLLDRHGASRPKLVVVEPDRANCLQVSAETGRRTAIAAGEATVMAMLECYEPSLTAWEILEKAADFYIDVPDETAVEALQRLARPLSGDPELRIGESGAAGLAGLLAATGDSTLRATLGLDAASRVLLIGTEGATDPDVYEALLHGRPLPAAMHA